MVESAEPKRKKKKRHNPLADFLLYLAVRTLMLFLFVFDVETNLRVARWLGRLLWKHYHRGRQRALENLRASFPDKPEAWIVETGRKSFEHLVMLPIDILFTPRLVKKYNWRDFSQYKHIERVKWLMHERRGLLLVTGHYGNFEIIGYLMSLWGFDINSIARPLDNKFISDYLYKVRQHGGQRLIHKKGAAQVLPRIIEAGGTVGFIADQDAGKKGIFVDFFGRKASTYKSIGLLALTYSLPIVAGYSRRIGDRFFFELGTTRVITPDEWADKKDPLRWITAEYTRAIEQFIREDPTQYWWLHRRWKHRPKEELRGAGTATAAACESAAPPEPSARDQMPVTRIKSNPAGGYTVTRLATSRGPVDE